MITVMTCIVVDKSTDHAKQHSISTVSIETSSDNSCTTREFCKVQSFYKSSIMGIFQNLCK